MQGCSIRYHLMLMVAVALLATGCSPLRFVPQDDCLLEKVEVKTDDNRIPSTTLTGYVRQRPNTKWFNLLKVPLGIYCLSGTDSTKRVNHFFQRIGEEPVVYDSLMADRGRADMQAAVHNLGFLNSKVTIKENLKRRRMKITYDVNAGKRYMVARLSRKVDDPTLDSLVQVDLPRSLLYEGMPFDVNILDDERSRLSALFRSEGYYQFNKNHVRFEADTTLGDYQVALVLRIPLFKPTGEDSLRQHQRYTIGKISYMINVEPQTFNANRTKLDSLSFRSRKYFFNKKMHLSPVFLINKTDIKEGEYYDEGDVQSTYGSLSSLSAVMGSNINMVASPSSPGVLDAQIGVLTNKRHGLSTALEGTNSAGDFGAAVSLGYQNRNLFRHSALFSFQLRGAFEAIKGLEGYSDQNYFEYSAEANMTFPEFMFPFLNHTFRHAANAQSIASVMYNSQDRPEFHRRVLTAAWRYRLSRHRMKRQYRIDLIDLNYVFMPWISETFSKEYLSDDGGRNAVLRYNYENLFIMKAGYSFQYTSVPPTSNNSIYGRNAYSVRCGLEVAGNMLYGLSHLLNSQYSHSLEAYTLFNIAYAQYLKFDFDLVKSLRIDNRNSFALHIAVGTAYPYGNSKILPYEKRYFSGGANSVRGWGVRGLGPGSFSGSDGRIDFIRQTGDMKLDLSVEWRTHLFWKIDGAAFVDAGNIWTLREYEEQPGGQFRFDNFYNQIAVAYGLGIRFNFGYFMMRLDGGMKAINPAYESGSDHYPIIHPRFGRDFHLHFAVGLPY